MKQETYNKNKSKVMVKTSIIIPIYNVEQYLEKCLDSLINQTLKDIEIICVNDESPDNCAAILKKYQKLDNRIIVLNQKNSGQGSARNRGLEIATGKYIQFLDSDDFYEPTCCEEMYNLMEQHPDTEVACFDTNIIYEAYEDHKEIDEAYFKMRYTGKTRVKPAMSDQLVDVNCWNKIFRKSFIDEHKLRFPEKLHYEDVGFFWFWLVRANKIYFYHKKLTNYLRRRGSFLGEIYEKSSQTIFDAFKVNELIYEDLIETKQLETYKTFYVRAYIRKIKWLVNCFYKDNWQDRKKLIDICADLLSKIDMTDVLLEDSDKQYLQRVITKNYYTFNAYNKYETDRVVPIFDEKNSVNLVFSTDKNYISYLAVTLQSIVENSSSKRNYDIIILCNDICEYQKRLILAIAVNRPNISIRFFNMDDYIEQYNLKNLLAINHITVSAYFRLFVGKIFQHYTKIIYLDCDLVVTTDIAKLFDTDIQDYPIAACLDTVISHSLHVTCFDDNVWGIFKKYMADCLGFMDHRHYFNSGVLIIDIPRFNGIDFDHLLELAKNNTKFFHDQNVLNAAFENDYFQLPQTWNFQWNIKFHGSDYKSKLSPSNLEMYESYDYTPSIVHYTSHVKPWNEPHHSFANIWWQYARLSPFYEIILKDLLVKRATAPQKQNKKNKVSKYLKRKRYIRCKYHWYRLLSHISSGKLQIKYLNKKNGYLDKLKQIKKANSTGA